MEDGARAVEALEFGEDGPLQAGSRIAARLRTGGRTQLREARILALAPMPGRRNDVTFMQRTCFVEWAGPGASCPGFVDLLERA